jgi:hypothetical protein
MYRGCRRETATRSSRTAPDQCFRAGVRVGGGLDTGLSGSHPIQPESPTLTGFREATGRRHGREPHRCDPRQEPQRSSSRCSGRGRSRTSASLGCRSGRGRYPTAEGRRSRTRRRGIVGVIIGQSPSSPGPAAPRRIGCPMCPRDHGRAAAWNRRGTECRQPPSQRWISRLPHARSHGDSLRFRRKACALPAHGHRRRATT